MTKLEEFLTRLAKLDVSALIKSVWELDHVQAFIIALNTEKGGFGVTSQLFDLGIDSNGEDLGEYSDFTIEIKKSQGLPFDHITLFDTGEFYDSFRVKPLNDGFEITADPIKEDTDLFVEFGEDIVGLTTESIQELQKFIIPDVEEAIRKALKI